MSATITVVLVHGVFAGSASSFGVIARLGTNGVAVIATPNPLRSTTPTPRTCGGQRRGSEDRSCSWATPADASHSVMVSRPDEVTSVIMGAITHLAK